MDGRLTELGLDRNFNTGTPQSMYRKYSDQMSSARWDALRHFLCHPWFALIWGYSGSRTRSITKGSVLWCRDSLGSTGQRSRVIPSESNLSRDSAKAHGVLHCIGDTEPLKLMDTPSWVTDWSRKFRYAPLGMIYAEKAYRAGGEPYFPTSPVLVNAKSISLSGCFIDVRLSTHNPLNTGDPYLHARKQHLLEAFWRTLIGDRTRELGSEALAFWWGIGAASLGRRMCITDRGFVGLIPPYARKGDVIFVARGLQAPLFLRKADAKPGSGIQEGVSWYYILIGECYIHGIMDGVYGPDVDNEIF
ncbi:hypothetical protein BKA65DRAFT_575054 [Rhexocercosporidium sp. MPI-PUGE-AT-0058]|nr:hypothetical protein BKA65DRAFT_575054 [Rhexocercosporidium sp. MPI-PUGE-AT-0058]